MLRAHTLATSEVDLPTVAVDEILQQLAGIPLGRSSVGILACHYDYAECGVIAALKEALPFPLVGITTFYQATPRASGLFELTITLLTSDDITFALAGGASADPGTSREVIRDTYTQAYETHGERPSLILSFLSVNLPISGDEYLRQLDAASGGVPSYGFVNSGDNESGKNIYVVCDGKPLSQGVAMLLMIGGPRARMYANDAPAERLLALSATVTEADGVVVREINGQPAATYMRKHSVPLDDRDTGVTSTVPFYCRIPGDSRFVGRALKNVAADGSLEFMAEIPEGALLRIGAVTAEDILEESGRILQRAVAENPDAALFLIGSCVGRFITLGLDATLEMDHATKGIPDGAAYLACYVCGEICPFDNGGRMVNRYYNNSFIVLALS